MFTFNKKLDHATKLAAARGLAVKRLPYFGSALYTLMPRPSPGMFERVGAGMAVTPKGLLFYDPRVVEDEWGLEDIEFGLLHEIGHMLRDHSKRCQEYGYDPKMWNMAGDAAINDDLVAAGFKPLSTDIVPSKIPHPKTKKPMKDGLTEEAYYDAIRQLPKKPKGGGGGDGGGGKGKPSRPGDGQGCGGCSGNPLDGVPGDGTHSSADGGRSEVEIERVKQQVAGAIQQHIKQHGIGSVPGGWSVWSDQQLAPPQVRWQDKVRRAVRLGVARVRGLVDYHYERPSRRQWALGYRKGVPVLPSMFAPLPRIGVFVDTSGSMGPDDLHIAMSEVSGVLKATGGNVLFGACDASVHGIQVVPDIKAACAALKGGGGTNFTPVFEEIDRMPKAHRPHVVIFLTDGGGPAPATPPRGIKVIWVLVGKHACVPFNETGGGHIDWGEQIFVPSAEQAA